MHQSEVPLSTEHTWTDNELRDTTLKSYRIPDCVHAAVHRILAKYPNRDVGMIAHLDLRSEVDDEQCLDCERAAIKSSAIPKEQLDVSTLPESVGRVRYAL